MLYVLIAERGVLHPDWRSIAMVGFLGGFTTFSALAVQALRLGEEAPLGALAYVAASLILGLVAAAAGLAIGRAA